MEPGSFGGKLREARKRLGLKQAELAARVGVNKNTVARWERGEFAPDDQATLQSLANLFGTTIGYFAGTEATTPANRAAYNEGILDAARRLRDLAGELEAQTIRVNARSMKTRQHSRKGAGIERVEKVAEQINSELDIHHRGKNDGLTE